jgi:hypothetical protein
MNFATVVAGGILLQGPRIDRNDKFIVAVTLRKYLDLVNNWPTRIIDANYDGSLGKPPWGSRLDIGHFSHEPSV